MVTFPRKKDGKFWLAFAVSLCRLSRCVHKRFVAIYVKLPTWLHFKAEVLHSGCAGVIQADVVEGPYGPAEQQMDGVEDRLEDEMLEGSLDQLWTFEESMESTKHETSLSENFFHGMFSTGHGLGETKAELIC